MITAAELAAVLGLPEPTDEQVDVIESPLVPGLVVAGAGSGKTETMAARVVYLVATGQVRPDQILGLTFTRKAAAALGQRIRRRLRVLAQSGLCRGDLAEALSGDAEVATYHSFGGRLIADFGALAGVEPGAKVLTATGAWQLARRVVNRWDGDLRTDLGPDQVTERLLAISGALADHLIDAPALAAELDELLLVLRSAPPGPRQRGPLHSGLAQHVKRLQDRQWILPLTQAFAEAKRACGVIDFADQMQLAATLAQQHPRVGAALRDRYRVVLLDEYQDTGHAQRVILRTAFGVGAQDSQPGHPVMAVGDPIQSIYSWRGAAASNLPRFVTDFPLASGEPAPIRSLLTSFRNPASVLTLANEISGSIRTGPGARIEVGALRPAPGAPHGDVRYGLFTTVADEDAWLARSIADLWETWMDGPSSAPPTTAVLVRRRSDMAATADALRAAGLPVEVVGLGGLLDEPEVVDLVATLRVLVDPTAGAAAIRLLTGARWQLGAADLEALAQRARALVRAVAPDDPASPSGCQAVRDAVAQAMTGEDIDSWTLVDAVADLGPAAQYSPEGYERLTRFAAHLRRLRGRMSQPLPDLIADLERATGLDIEVRLANGSGRIHLDAFADVVAEVAATGAGPAELLDYLDTAAEREDGLTPGEVATTEGRVQVLTVHAAKGLEWQVVAVPHLTDGVFPITRGSTWLGDSAQLPTSLRGDRAELPELSLPAGADQKDLAEALADHAAEFGALRLVEERRLLYVALTRAESTLLVSGHHWGATTSTPSGPSEFLLEAAALMGGPANAQEWAAAADPTSPNPMTAQPRTAQWPPDPLGTRRPAVRAGADRVLAAMHFFAAQRASPMAEPLDSLWATAVADPGGQADTGRPEDNGRSPATGDPADLFGWAADVTTLLTERAAAVNGPPQVELPGTLSVSALVELADDPQALARRLRRPVPVEPVPAARRGTAFHQWLERFFRGEALLDVRDLPGAGDRWAGDDPEFEELRRQFLASPWANKVPEEIEVPFATRIAGIGIRGRIDAVFADADGGLTVVDWKTGRPPPSAKRPAAAVQLACYRVAIAELAGIALTSVRAAFHYVPTGTTLAPVDLLDSAGIERLIEGATAPAGTGVGPSLPAGA